MDEDMFEKIKKQHLSSYKKSILEIIKNNTNTLIDEDIMALLRKPPLDSMDVIKVKLLDLAKKNNLVLDNENLDKIMEKYRRNIIKSCSLIKKIRIDSLNMSVDNFEPLSIKDVVKINKKDFTQINKQIKKIIKDRLSSSFEKYILSDLKKIFNSNLDSSFIDKMKLELTKFNKEIYQKQLINNLNIKVLVKDTTLISSVKEQADRYLFTINNSHLLNDNKKN